MNQAQEGQAQEAQRQQTLLQALMAPAARVDHLALHQTGARALRGLRAYRANAEMVADQALAGVFPTVRRMVSEDNFTHLAREFWRAQPPQRGDLGEWGLEFPAWLAAHPHMTPWPYLGDAAQLDWGLHQCERAADATLDAASLMQLQSVDPAALRLRFMPGVVVLCSTWPIFSIYQAHQLQDGPAAEQAFAALRSRLTHQDAGENVLVARHGWRAVVREVDGVSASWVQNLLHGASLAQALSHAGPQFDFGAWLTQALTESWLQATVEIVK
jgi:Putative DNA-binding domain